MIDSMKKFFSSFSFMVGFMITCIFMQMTLGGKFLNKFLWLVLAGMLLTNADEFSKKLKQMGTVTAAKTEEKAWTPQKDDKGTITASTKAGLVFPGMIYY